MSAVILVISRTVVEMILVIGKQQARIKVRIAGL